MGFGVWGLGFGVWGLGFGVWGLGFGVWSLVCFWRGAEDLGLLAKGMCIGFRGLGVLALLRFRGFGFPGRVGRFAFRD